MAQQSSGEFASANPTKGEEDARVQERGIRAKISLSACSNTKYLQRPTPSHLNKNAPSLQGLSHAGVARSRRRGVSHLGQNPERLRRGAECARALEHISEGVPLRLDGQGFAHAQRDKDVKIARVARNIFESSSSPQVEDVPVKAVILGEAYIKRGLKAGKPDRFVCLIGETGKARLMSGSDFLFNPRSHFASWAIGKIFQL